MIDRASIADAPRAAALLRATSAGRLNTDAGMRYRMESATPEEAIGCWKAEREGELIGLAYAGINTFAASATDGFGGVTVAGAHRRRGIGAALWEAVEAHLGEIGVRRLVVHGEADAGSTTFATRRGLALAARQILLEVDPRTIEPLSTIPPDVRLCPFSEFADDPMPLYDADLESILDEPGAADHSGVTYAAWRRYFWDHPDYDRQLSMAALVGGGVVGVTFLMADRDSGRAMNAGTSVKRSFRGRGLGLLMKRRALAAAAEARIVTVVTENDDTNAAMVAINERLGYTPFSTGHSWVLER